MIGAGLAGLSGLTSLFKGRDLSDDAINGGALNDLFSREPEPQAWAELAQAIGDHSVTPTRREETHELQARFLPLILAKLFKGRELEASEPETQELEARFLPLVGAGLAGLSGIAGLFKGRDLSDDITNINDLLSREPEPQAWAELIQAIGDNSVTPTRREETQELQARFLPLILAKLFKGRELEARETETETQELQARFLPLIFAKLFKGRDLEAREPEPQTWADLAHAIGENSATIPKREPLRRVHW